MLFHEVATLSETTSFYPNLQVFVKIYVLLPKVKLFRLVQHSSRVTYFHSAIFHKVLSISEFKPTATF